jgi:hypothetical protein
MSAAAPLTSVEEREATVAMGCTLMPGESFRGRCEEMTPQRLRAWRRRRFPADTEKASLEQAVKWYGVKSRRAWEYWEAGDRPVPQALVNRIKAENGGGGN